MSEAILTEVQIKYMVDRFLSWRLPDTFNPDAGISFKRVFNEHTPHPMKNEPIGTNLFSATQADEMVRHMLTGMPTKDDGPPKVELVSGAPVPADDSHTEIKPNGQQKDYIVLSPEERAKGFVRPYRETYVHVGLKKPTAPMRDLDEEERARYAQYGYVKYEAYPRGEQGGSSVTGRYWTQADLDKIGTGCKTETRMSAAIAATYARDPKFYGSTFCCGCNTHLPLAEFVWKGTEEIVGS